MIQYVGTFTNDLEHMSPAVNPARLQVWIIMEFAGILPKKKRQKMIAELERKFEANELNSSERRILAASKLHPYNKRERARFLKQELRKWEKRTAV